MPYTPAIARLLSAELTSDICVCDRSEAEGIWLLVLMTCLAQYMFGRVIPPVSVSVQLKNWMNEHSAEKHNTVHEVLPVKSQ